MKKSVHFKTENDEYIEKPLIVMKIDIGNNK